SFAWAAALRCRSRAIALTGLLDKTLNRKKLKISTAIRLKKAPTSRRPISIGMRSRWRHGLAGGPPPAVRGTAGGGASSCVAVTGSPPLVRGPASHHHGRATAGEGEHDDHDDDDPDDGRDAAAPGAARGPGAAAGLDVGDQVDAAV